MTLKNPDRDNPPENPCEDCNLPTPDDHRVCVDCEGGSAKPTLDDKLKEAEAIYSALHEVHRMAHNYHMAHYRDEHSMVDDGIISVVTYSVSSACESARVLTLRLNERKDNEKSH